MLHVTNARLRKLAVQTTADYNAGKRRSRFQYVRLEKFYNERPAEHEHLIKHLFRPDELHFSSTGMKYLADAIKISDGDITQADLRY